MPVSLGSQGSEGFGSPVHPVFGCRISASVVAPQVAAEMEESPSSQGGEGRQGRGSYFCFWFM
jgi:hypothetical protein